MNIAEQFNEYMTSYEAEVQGQRRNTAKAFEQMLREDFRNTIFSKVGTILNTKNSTVEFAATFTVDGRKFALVYLPSAGGDEDCLELYGAIGTVEIGKTPLFDELETLWISGPLSSPATMSLMNKAIREHLEKWRTVPSDPRPVSSLSLTKSPGGNRILG